MKLIPILKKVSLTRKAFLVSALASVYSFLIERYWLQVNHYSIVSDRLPKSFHNFKIAVLTDLHYGILMPEPWIEQIINRVNSIGADVIIGVGDYVHAKRIDSELLVVWRHLKNLKAKNGVYFVNGNHDHWANTKLATQLLQESGFNVEHSPKLISKNGEQILISGVGDFWESNFLLDQTLSPFDPRLFKIVLAHNPDSVDLKHNTFVDLFVSGHTHGGQVRVPFLNYSPILPVKNKTYDCGIKKLKNKEQLFISRGIGWAVLPIRFNAPPEIAVLNLKVL